MELLETYEFEFKDEGAISRDIGKRFGLELADPRVVPLVDQVLGHSHGYAVLNQQPWQNNRHRLAGVLKGSEVDCGVLVYVTIVPFEGTGLALVDLEELGNRAPAKAIEKLIRRNEISDLDYRMRYKGRVIEFSLPRRGRLVKGYALLDGDAPRSPDGLDPRFVVAGPEYIEAFSAALLRYRSHFKIIPSELGLLLSASSAVAGGEPGSKKTCPNCSGKGETLDYSGSSPREFWNTCHACDGTGMIANAG